MPRAPVARAGRAGPAKDTTARPARTGGNFRHPAGQNPPSRRALSRRGRAAYALPRPVFDLRPIERLASNLARWERLVRIGLGLLFVVLPLSGLVEGLAGTALLLFAWVPLVTGAIGWCPIYSLLGLSSRRR